MSITIKFSPAFFEHTNHLGSIEVAGKTVKEILENLLLKLPDFRDLLFNQSNDLSVMIIYQGDIIVPNQLDRTVEDGHEIMILPMIYGG
jgi:hypothetical protein